MTTMILYNGPIYTMNPEQPRAAAIAIRDRRILAVGTEGKVHAAAGARAEMINLNGRAVIPALTDAHVHLIWYALSQREVQLDGFASYDEAVLHIAAVAEERPKGSWIIGRGWDQNRWGRWPAAAELDAVVPEHPVYMTRRDGHSVWVNSLALHRAGINEQTPEPAGGTIRREHGQNTGVLLENAIDLVRRHIPAPTDQERLDALRAVISEAHRYGMVGMHLPTNMSPGDGKLQLGDLQTLRERGELALRTLTYIGPDQLDAALEVGLRSGFGDDWIRLGGLKLFADGTLGSETADMLSHYEGRRHLGMAVLEVEQLNDFVQRANQGGLAVMVHAIGDAANRKVLNAIEAARPSAAPLMVPNRIEHCQVLHPRDIPRFAELGVVASMQPIHCISDIDAATQLWGERCANAYAWRALQHSGAVLAFGSDAPIEPLNPWLSIRAAVLRQRLDGTPSGGWYPEQTISLKDALAGFTSGTAFAAGVSQQQGQLIPGKLADLAVLAADPFTVDPTTLHLMSADLTILDGNVVWDRLQN
jgi:predicted amidohydrolase YtcJ